MEATERLTGTIEEQVWQILDYRDSEMWLSGVIYDGDHLDIDETYSDVVEFSDVMDVPEGMDEYRLQREIEGAIREWAECHGLDPFSRTDVIENARDRAYGALGELTELDVDTLRELVPEQGMDYVAETIREAIDSIYEAYDTLCGFL